MKHFLINPSKGLVIGVASRRGTGWAFTPFTSAHGGSRKAHATKEAAALRYQSPSCRWIEAVAVSAAAKQATALKAAYDRNEPCSKCEHLRSDGGCDRGAAPDCARNLGQCAKFRSKEELSRAIYASTVDPLLPGEKLKSGGCCTKHPDVVLETKLSCCPKCEAEIDGLVMHTISDPILSSGEKPKAGHLPDCAVGVTGGAPNKADAGQPLEQDSTQPDAKIYCPQCEQDALASVETRGHRRFYTCKHCGKRSCDELREDVVIYEIESRKVTNIAGSNLGETGTITASRRLVTVCSRLNDHYDATCVPAGKFKTGDILPDEL